MERQLTTLMKSCWLSLLSIHGAPRATYQINSITALCERILHSWQWLEQFCTLLPPFRTKSTELFVLNTQLNSPLPLHVMSDHRSVLIPEKLPWPWEIFHGHMCLLALKALHFFTGIQKTPKKRVIISACILLMATWNSNICGWRVEKDIWLLS